MIEQEFPYPNDYLKRYGINKMWANQELDQQFQVKINKISPSTGEIDNFTYMGKWRLTPISGEFYHVFTMGGTDIGFWDFSSKVNKCCPLERWINAGELANYRGLQLDIYNQQGYQYPKGLTWIMRCYDGVSLLAVKVNPNYAIPVGTKMWFRCYTTDLDIAHGVTAATSNVCFKYDCLEFSNSINLQKLYVNYVSWKTWSGLTTVFVNGILKKTFPIPSELIVGDLVEVNHDPTVYAVEYYNIKDLNDFYSDLDSKRKYIVHPPKPTTDDFSYKYFDDNDYYLVDENGTGLYFHRNSEDAVRQLTHIDVSISDDYVNYIKAQLPELNNTNKLRLRIVYRQTKWDFKLQWEASRIKYLYRLNDNGIIAAFTGVYSTLPEWTASNLETCPTNALLRSSFLAIDTNMVANALGYNADTKVVGDSPLALTKPTSGRGMLIPPSYRHSSTVWEFDKGGLLLGFYNITNMPYLVCKYPDCSLVEFTMGVGGKNIDSVVTKDSVTLNKYLSYRVFTSGWLVDTSESDNNWVDVTDSNSYSVKNGLLTWNVDLNNKVGMILYNDQTLTYEFDLEHLDKSLSFDITEIWDGGGIPLVLAPAQIDIFMNGYSLIENVDYTIDYPNVYIVNKQYLNKDLQHFSVRAFGICPIKDAPKNECELGYVIGGVIGDNKRYNVRDDRVTRIVIGGRLYLSEDVPSSELNNGNNLWSLLNGLPYMVKHVYCSNKYTKEYTNYYLYDEARELDQRVSDYLTAHCIKPSVGVIGDIVGDKYRLYSPLMNAITNAIRLGILVVDELGSEYLKYTAQYIATKVRDYIWWLNYDPIKLGYDNRYFSLQPHNDLGLVTVGANEFKFLNQVNDIYFKGELVMEGYYEVNNYGQ